MLNLVCCGMGQGAGRFRNTHMLRFDGWSGRQDVGARQHIFQLANIARPLVVGKLPYGILAEGTAFVEAEFPRAADEVVGERGDVAGPITQWRQGQGDDRKTIVEVFTERALTNGLIEILVGRGDESDVGLDRLCTAHAIKSLILQDTQQVALQRERHVPDLIEKDGSTLSNFDFSCLAFHGAGERSLFMAEELVLEKIFGDRRAVYGHKGFVFSRAPSVNRASHDLLAGSGLTQHEHGHVGCRGLFGQGELCGKFLILSNDRPVTVVQFLLKDANLAAQ